MSTDRPYEQIMARNQDFNRCKKNKHDFGEKDFGGPFGKIKICMKCGFEKPAKQPKEARHPIFRKRLF